MFPFGEKKKEETAGEFFSRFNATTNKLKKRFLKKPNISEVCEEYCELANECELIGNHQYTVFCWLHAAKCQELLKDQQRQLYFLIKAGRKIIEIEKKNIKLGCPSVGNENFQIACDIFNQAITLCEEIEGFSIVGTSLAMELAKTFGSTSDGIRMLRLANEKSTFIPAYKLLLSFFLKEDDYYGALQVVTDITNFIEEEYGSNPSAYYKDILHECEITTVFLLLLLRPTPKNITATQSQLLQKYSKEEEVSSDGKDSSSKSALLNNDEMILMQSLVLACQSEEYDALLEMEGEMWPFLTDEQKNLLRTLVKSHCKI